MRRVVTGSWDAEIPIDVDVLRRFQLKTSGVARVIEYLCIYIYIYLYSMHLHLFAGWWIESTPSLKMAFQYKPSPCQSKLKAPDSRSSLQQPLMKLQKLESGSQINSTVKLPYLKWEFWSPKNYAFCFRKRGSDAWMTTWAALRFHWH